MNGTQRRMPARTAANDRRWSARLRRQESIQRCPYVRKFVIARTDVNNIVLNIRVFILNMQENNPMLIFFVTFCRLALSYIQDNVEAAVINRTQFFPEPD
jgi:hypothetical protein